VEPEIIRLVVEAWLQSLQGQLHRTQDRNIDFPENTKVLQLQQERQGFF
jgi:hypothetical protein